MAKAGILIVEDSYIVAFHLQKTLESEGYEIVGIKTSGEEALELLEHKLPDLVLMDIMLSGKLDGIDTASIIQSRHHVPVVYITALTDKDTIQRAKVTEPFGYLTKPFEDREIFTVIEMALYKHHVESKLRKSEERYLSTIRSISDAAVIFDNDFLITYMNPSAEVLTGWCFHEAQGEYVFEVLKLKDPNCNCLVNPAQSNLDRSRSNLMPDGLLLKSKKGFETPIGEGSINPIVDHKNQLNGLILIFKDITDRVARELLQKDMEKQRLTAMVEGQENERSRIAKDLHDGLGQMLNAIKMNINFVLEEEGGANMLFRLIDEAIQETVRISENLLPAKLRDFDLVTCLKSMCNQLQQKGTPSIIFEALGVNQRITQSQKVNFYRVAQEALNNAIRHSDASLITVQLSQEEDRLQLSIEDDGKGMSDMSNITYSSMKHGLGNMRDRAEIMGGKLTVESDKNRGTLIILEVPLSKKLTNAEV